MPAKKKAGVVLETSQAPDTFTTPPKEASISLELNMDICRDGEYTRTEIKSLKPKSKPKAKKGKGKADKKKNNDNSSSCSCGGDEGSCHCDEVDEKEMDKLEDEVFAEMDKRDAKEEIDETLVQKRIVDIIKAFKNPSQFKLKENKNKNAAPHFGRRNWDTWIPKYCSDVYLKKKLEFEKEHAKVISPMVGYARFHPTTREIIKIYTLEEFKEAYSHVRVAALGTFQCGFLDTWLEDDPYIPCVSLQVLPVDNHAVLEEESYMSAILRELRSKVPEVYAQVAGAMALFHEELERVKPTVEIVDTTRTIPSAGSE